MKAPCCRGSSLEVAAPGPRSIRPNLLGGATGLAFAQHVELEPGDLRGAARYCVCTDVDDFRECHALDGSKGVEEVRTEHRHAPRESLPVGRSRHARPRTFQQGDEALRVGSTKRVDLRLELLDRPLMGAFLSAETSGALFRFRRARPIALEVLDKLVSVGFGGSKLIAVPGTMVTPGHTGGVVAPDSRHQLTDSL